MKNITNTRVLMCLVVYKIVLRIGNNKDNKKIFTLNETLKEHNLKLNLIISCSSSCKHCKP